MPVLCCLALAACGGSSGSSSTSTSAGGTRSSTANIAFDAQVSSICRRANAAYIAAHGSAHQVAVIQRYLLVFRGVKAPAPLQSVYSRYLTVLAKELAALKRGDSAGLVKLRDTQAGPLVRQLGATGCYS
jgi:hypothetical protein